MCVELTRKFKDKHRNNLIRYKITSKSYLLNEENKVLFDLFLLITAWVIEILSFSCHQMLSNHAEKSVWQSSSPEQQYPGLLQDVLHGLQTQYVGQFCLLDVELAGHSRALLS